MLLFIAGGLGTLARYGLSGIVQRDWGGTFPWGTLAVNTIGCFIAGLLWVLAENRTALSGEMRAIIFVGFLGAFTTFSTFVLETGNLLRDSDWSWAILNASLQNGMGIVALFTGIAFARLMSG